MCCSFSGAQPAWPGVIGPSVPAVGWERGFLLPVCSEPAHNPQVLHGDLTEGIYTVQQDGVGIRFIIRGGLNTHPGCPGGEGAFQHLLNLVVHSSLVCQGLCPGSELSHSPTVVSSPFDCVFNPAWSCLLLLQAAGLTRHHLWQLLQRVGLIRSSSDSLSPVRAELRSLS